MSYPHLSIRLNDGTTETYQIFGYNPETKTIWISLINDPQYAGDSGDGLYAWDSNWQGGKWCRRMANERTSLPKTLDFPESIIGETNMPGGEFITARCTCGRVLGEFYSIDDNGSVIIRCPACRDHHELHNQMLSHPKEWAVATDNGLEIQFKDEPTSSVPKYTGEQTFADVVNSNGDIKEALQFWLDETNKACAKHPNNPRDAGVINPKLFISDPLICQEIDLQDREGGAALVKGGGQTIVAYFTADDMISQWSQMDLMEKFRAN